MDHLEIRCEVVDFIKITQDRVQCPFVNMVIDLK